MGLFDHRKKTSQPEFRLEVDESKNKRRLIGAIVLMAISMVALTIGLISMLNREIGWQVVSANSRERNCSKDFILNYDFSPDGTGATLRHRELGELYGKSAEKAYQVFTPDEIFEGVNNLAYLNSHVNETVSVDEVLYRALEQVYAFENRAVFLAPVYVEYNRIFSSESLNEAQEADPTSNPDQKAFISTLVGFANDPEMIHLEFFGNNQVCLNVSDAYLRFAEEYEIDTFVDFGWMKNAFIADFLASTLTENGFTTGYLASYDGFTRNFDPRGTAFSVNVFDSDDQAINLAAVLDYAAPRNLVYLRAFPLYESDQWSYFTFPDGRVVTGMIDPADGMSKSSVDTLLAYSAEKGCAEILLEMFPIFVADQFSEERIQEIKERDIYTVWCEDSVLYHNDADIQLSLQPEKSAVSYEIAYFDE